MWRGGGEGGSTSGLSPGHDGSKIRDVPLGSVEPQDTDTVVRLQTKLEGEEITIEWVRVEQEDSSAGSASNTRCAPADVDLCYNISSRAMERHPTLLLTFATQGIEI